jgi:hypothetical protein
MIFGSVQNLQSGVMESRKSRTAITANTTAKAEAAIMVTSTGTINGGPTGVDALSFSIKTLPSCWLKACRRLIFLCTTIY